MRPPVPPSPEFPEDRAKHPLTEEVHTPSIKRLRVLLCGYGPLGLALLQGLLACQDSCEIVGVFRWTARTNEIGEQEADDMAFGQCVATAGLRDFHGKGINSYDFSAFLNEIQPHVLLIGSWGEILQPHVLEHPGCLAVNCHPAALPKHRGANPYASVILTGETETGVTFHRMLPALDAGPILLQCRVPLYGTDTSLMVRDRCAEKARAMIPDLLACLCPHCVDGKLLDETLQDADVASYYAAPQDEDGLIDWQQPPDALSRQLRGLYPWILPSSYMNVLGSKQRVYFYQPRLVTQPLCKRNPDIPSGSIVSRHGQRLTMATSAPDCLLEVSSSRIVISTMNTWLTDGLGTFLALCLLRPGKQFFS